MPLPVLPTALVGSYAQPDWLIDRAKLAGRFPPRVRAKELWRVEPALLAQAQDDATQLAIRAQERAGLDLLTDGEIRRESYSNHFATALDGVDVDNPGTALDRSGHPNPVPRIVGPIHRPHAGPGPRPGVPARPHRPPGEDDRARAVHDEPAGAERPLPGRRVGRDGLRRGGQRGDQGPVRGRRGRRPDRRALPAGPPGRRPRLRARRAEPRAGGRHRDDRGAPVLRLRGDHPRAPAGLLVPARAGRLPGATRSRSRPRSPGSTWACWPTCPTRRSSWACSTCRRPRSRRAEVVAARVRRAYPYRPAAAAGDRARTAG